ncbi:Reticulocyte-binding protein 2 a [Nymphon striatum]|nr:Reticulocyte-binding protein 2 a [Nymphon striatum]
MHIIVLTVENCGMTAPNAPNSYWFAGGGNDNSRLSLPDTKKISNRPTDTTEVDANDNNVLATTDESLSPVYNGSHIIVPIYDDTNQSENEKQSKNPKRADAYWFAQSAPETSKNSESSPSGNEEEIPRDNREGSPSLRHREHRVRLAKERQQEERHKKLDEIKQAALAHDNYRHQCEEDRRKRIDETKNKENDRIHAVQERRKQILDAEMDRREALLRRKMEREVKLEAKKNAQRNAISFAFGSAAPRLYESYEMKSSQSTTNLAALTPPARRSVSLNRNNDGINRGVKLKKLVPRPVNVDIFNLASPNADYLVSSPSNHEVAYASPTSPSDIALEQSAVGIASKYENHTAGNFIGSGLLFGEDLMTKSCSSLSSSSPFGRGRRKNDLRPTIPRYRDTPTVHRSSGGSQMRGAISMSRLDQLAQPRRRRFLPSTPETIKNVSPSAKSMSRSMSNIAFGHTIVSSQPRTPRTNLSISRSSSSASMPHSDYRASSPSKQSNPKSSPPSSNLNKKSISMVHLASTPRPTKASKMRADALSKEKGLNKSMTRINNCMSTEVRVVVVTILCFDCLLLSCHKKACLMVVVVTTARKPTTDPRPKSSMSEHSTPSSQASAATLPVRMRSATPHKPRPLSMTAAIQDTKERTPRSSDRKRPWYYHTKFHAPKPPRAKSATSNARDQQKGVESSTTPKPQREKPKSTPVPKKQILKNKAKTPSKSPSPQLENNAMVSSNKPDIIPDEDAKPPIPVQSVKSDENSPDQTPTGAPEAGIPSNGKPKITSEEEAKVALAERRKQAREQAEKAAEEERIRQEKLRQEEEEKLQREEAEARLAEAEAIRLAEEHRKQEEEKLHKAIEERQKQEEEAKNALEEEAKLKVEREEADRLAREEAERLRKENEERLKQDEEERKKRRQKVAAIMSRTRGKTASSDEQNTTPSDSTDGTDEINENNCDVSNKNVSGSSENICQINNNENDIKSATANSGELINSYPENVQPLNCASQPPPPAPMSVSSDQIDISINNRCNEMRDSSPQPGSLDSSSSVNTVIFNGANDHPDISELDSLSSLNKDNGLQIHLQTNGHHINNSELTVHLNPQPAGHWLLRDLALDDALQCKFCRTLIALLSSPEQECIIPVNVESMSSPSVSSPESSSVTMSPQNSQEVEQLIDVNLAPATTNNKNQFDNSFFIEDLNSNINNSPSNPFIAFEDDNTTAHISAKTQDTTPATVVRTHFIVNKVVMEKEASVIYSSKLEFSNFCWGCTPCKVGLPQCSSDGHLDNRENLALRASEKRELGSPRSTRFRPMEHGLRPKIKTRFEHLPSYLNNDCHCVIW